MKSAKEPRGKNPKLVAGTPVIPLESWLRRVSNAEIGKSFDREWAGPVTIGRIGDVGPVAGEEIDIAQYWVRGNAPDVRPYPSLFLRVL
jgi:hypothetical protein